MEFGVSCLNMCLALMILFVHLRSTDGALISRYRPVRMISQLLDLSAENAVDGNLNNDLDRCNCCAATNYGTDPWFQIDLQEQHVITDIDVIGPSTIGQGQDYIGMEVFIGNTSSIEKSESIYNNTEQARRQRLQLRFLTPSRFRYLSMVLNGQLRMLIVCELQIFGECQPGRFGDLCEICHCLNGPCDRTTGICPPGGCSVGYTGAKCDTACPNGRYGLNCSQICGSCANGSTCNTVTGRCSVCAPGYRPPLCKQVCNAGSFGVNCGRKCGRCRFGQTCDPVEGVCPNGCQPGYIGVTCTTSCTLKRWGELCANDCGRCKQNEPCDVTTGRCMRGCQAGYGGSMCVTVCSLGTYGENCARKCGSCNNGAPCDRVTGVCQGCGPGYLGIFCNRTCVFGKWGSSCLQECGQCTGGVTCNLETGRCTSGCAPGYQGGFCKQACLPGRYGINCQSTCGNCRESAPCDVSTGRCPAGCVEGYMGDMCNQASQTGSLSTTASIAIGVSVVAVVIIVLVTVGLVFFVRKRKGEQFHQTQAYTPGTNGVTITTTKDVPDVLKAEQPNVGGKSSEDLDLGEAVDREEVVKHDYDGFKTRQRGVRVHEFWDYIYDRKKKGCALFNQEFKCLKSGLVQPANVAMSSENRYKNRYKGLYAYDHSRVKLETDDESTDYINACYVNGFGKIAKFIACQGPTEFTKDDFWMMVWQQGTEQIVILTKLKENGAKKCTKYWPDSSVAMYGDVYVKLISTKENPDFITRHLAIWASGGEKRTITQYQLESWPDKDIPDTTWTLVKFWRYVMEDYNKYGREAGPIVVHCSAGVGRTGTFIAIDNLYQQAQIEGCLTPFHVVDTLRDQRVSMVQNEKQYVYLHEVVADALLFGTYDVKPEDLADVYKYLLENDEKSSSQTKLETQHELIVTSKKPDPIVMYDKSLRLPEDLEYSIMKSFASRNSGLINEEKDADSLKTIKLPYHSGDTGFLLVNRPTKDTSDQLWSLITGHNVRTILTISAPSGEESNSRTVLEVHNSDVEIVDEHVTENFIEETFRIPQKTEKDSEPCTFDLTFFDLKIWDEDTNLPTSISNALQCLDAVRVWQHELSDTQPILVICRDNIPSAGLICILLNEVDRCTGPVGRVNIIESVKLMRACDSSIAASIVHYKYVYEVLTGVYTKTTSL